MKTLPDKIAEWLDQPKPWWLSKTVISGLAGLATALVGLAGITLDLEMVNEIITLVLIVVFLIGVILGRFDAKQPISLRKPTTETVSNNADSRNRKEPKPFDHGFGGDY